MSNLKNELIRLGYEDPSLRPHLTPIIDKISATRQDLKASRHSKISNRSQRKVIKEAYYDVLDALAHLRDTLWTATIEADGKKKAEYDRLYTELSRLRVKFDRFGDNI